jgi:hypothetical protein
MERRIHLGYAKTTGKSEMDWILQGKKSSSAGNNTLKVETMNF